MTDIPMTDVLTIVDRCAIDALRGEFTDAGTTGDYDRFAALFTADGVWRIPDGHIEFTGREAIRAGIERLQANWEYFIQNVHPGTIRIDGDTATGRSYVSELGRMRDGSSHLNHSIYHDRYRRTPDGWRFTERSYEVRYVDSTPLAGSSPHAPERDHRG
ncbi:nuclear transport factor 2 family protein [Streptomyces sp. NBC_00669]|uniref:nuclear transport factor 2 family protein n=1 Tax=unclassified Streptomyces TaxID=2593676 RepID=UPI002E35EEC6|nr:nuclear transport factor 2 family protein [Streptomyces sp. NBC_00669]